MGGQPELRTGFTTDNGNQILDVRGFTIRAPRDMERQINAIAGVVTVGLFAERPADIVIVGSDSGGVRQF
jgi:ribose 5-phosphate isomerase A